MRALGVLFKRHSVSDPSIMLRAFARTLISTSTNTHINVKTTITATMMLTFVALVKNVGFIVADAVAVMSVAFLVRVEAVVTTVLIKMGKVAVLALLFG